jgi:hypothetical protein
MITVATRADLVPEGGCGIQPGLRAPSPMKRLVSSRSLADKVRQAIPGDPDPDRDLNRADLFFG